MKYTYPIVVVPASILLPIIIALIKHKCLTREFRIILYYLIVSGLINMVAVILASQRIHNLYMLHFYTIVEFAILSLFFKEILKGKLASNVITVLIIAFTILCIVNFSFLQSINKFNTYTRPIEAIILIGCCLAYFEKQSRTELTISWGKTPVNWIIIGILLYFSGALFLFTFSNVVSVEVAKSIKLKIWNIHATLVLIMYLLFAVGFSKLNARVN